MTWKHGSIRLLLSAGPGAGWGAPRATRARERLTPPLSRSLAQACVGPIVLLAWALGAPLGTLTWRQFGLVVAKGLLDNVLSDYLWARAILLVGELPGCGGGWVAWRLQGLLGDALPDCSGAKCSLLVW